ncbi:uncharacterized protein SPPG_06005 [Spizellomyces punctatus DAOM BR117]|uniref:Polyadenylation factor subunit 2 n=1 Tax=Spizellomyces punctatus (strain DAOM BR117) TaxID=645134 RepID=A0A0L0HDK7_SPIPD|nr:uncharacterized protein SPPG_06005 [Spizellomyces punctatus DAOM BR117]KNC99054.1 hypothetical protein SPPG_06005 [Spizellomyces punctatus DAOM BR117]|eukprot:XP_016607094.1 hypothetical protein SPPG_06005 [Spizellomyces punctatus DAOM BR117]
MSSPPRQGRPQPFQRRYNNPTGQGFTPNPTDKRDFVDGKRVRKAIQRRTVDYNGVVIRHLELRSCARGWKDYVAIQPDPNFIVNIQPPFCYPNNHSTSVTTKFVHTSTNKIRCPINAVRWTPEGRRLITGASSGEFTLWNGLTFNFETILQAHDKAVRTMVWSHNDTWLITGDDSGIIKYWQSNMNNLKVVVAHKETVRDLTFSPTDAKYASCSDDGTIKIWSFADAIEERTLTGHGWDVKCIDWHPSKALLASGSKDNLVKLWDPKTGKALATLHGHKNTILGIEWNKNGNWLVTASRDQLLRVYDIRTMRELQAFRGHKKDVQSVAWHPVHESLFVSGGSDGSMMFWDVGTEHSVGGMEGAHESSVFALDWHPMGHILVSGSNDHTTRFWTRNRPGDAMHDRFAFTRQQADAMGLKAEDEEDEASEEGSQAGGDWDGGAGGALPGLGEFDGIPGIGFGGSGISVGGRYGRDEEDSRATKRPRVDGESGHGRSGGNRGGRQNQNRGGDWGGRDRGGRQDQYGRGGSTYSGQGGRNAQNRGGGGGYGRSHPQDGTPPTAGPPPFTHTFDTLSQQQPPPVAPSQQGQQLLTQLAAQGFPINAGLVNALTGLGTGPAGGSGR